MNALEGRICRRSRSHGQRILDCHCAVQKIYDVAAAAAIFFPVFRPTLVPLGAPITIGAFHMASLRAPL